MYIIHNDELKHYGVLGMKWGIRRYQDENGRLTAAGKARYYGDNEKRGKEAFKNAQEAAHAKKEYSRYRRYSQKQVNKMQAKKDAGQILSKRQNKHLTYHKNKVALQDKRLKALTKEYDESIKTAKKYADPKIVNKILSKNFNETKAAKMYERSPRRALGTGFLVLPPALAATIDMRRTDKYAEEIERNRR